MDHTFHYSGPSKIEASQQVQMAHKMVISIFEAGQVVTSAAEGYHCHRDSKTKLGRTMAMMILLLAMLRLPGGI